MTKAKCKNARQNNKAINYCQEGINYFRMLLQINAGLYIIKFGDGEEKFGDRKKNLSAKKEKKKEDLGKI